MDPWVTAWVALGGLLIGSFVWSPYTIHAVVDGQVKHFVQAS